MVVFFPTACAITRVDWPSGAEGLSETRRGKATRHLLFGLLRQSVFGRYGAGRVTSVGQDRVVRLDLGKYYWYWRSNRWLSGQLTRGVWAGAKLRWYIRQRLGRNTLLGHMTYQFEPYMVGSDGAPPRLDVIYEDSSVCIWTK